MDSQENIQSLFFRYLSGNCSEGELDTLLEYFHIGKDEALLRKLIAAELAKNETNEQYRQSVDESYTYIQQKIKRLKTIPFYRRSWLRVAAIIIVLIAVTSAIYMNTKSKESGASHTIAVNTDYTQYITLPDSSKVILKNGSRLEYPSKFSDSTREVALTGEAYFDIRHEDAHPFIIHTGNISTTVLGTAFNIYATKDSVTVTVTRGKVKVSDEHKILGVLTPDQQLVYAVKKYVAVNKQVQAVNTVSWTKQDMSFDGARFGDIATQMEKRYHVHIRFANADLANCPLSASFIGTESLEGVVSVLCTARGATYQIAKDNVIIDGQGCK